MGPVIVLVVMFMGFIGFLTFIHFVPVGLWIAAKASGASVGMGTLVAMRLRGVKPEKIVKPRISAVKAGLNIETDMLEAHYLARSGNRNENGENDARNREKNEDSVSKVVTALISAQKAGITLTFERAAAIDLAGRDVLDAVKMSVNPKVIQTPKVAAMAGDGIQLMAVSKITLRANIDRLVGGAGEETILARVGEGIVTTIGSATSHKQVLENPDRISQVVMSKGLDAGTAFEILSIDIADVDVGANIGAKLQMDQAEADKNIAQARAESRRAEAVATEQEMKARYQEALAKVAEAEAQVPKALAHALMTGNIGALDYYNLRNVIADTDMRRGFASDED